MASDARTLTQAGDEMNHIDASGQRSRRWTRATAIPAVLALALGACDFEVTNPGPVQDEFLNEQGAFEAMIGGMKRATSEAMNFTAFQGAAVARELHPTGGTGSFGLNVPVYNGRLLPDEQNAPWENSQQARWVAEDGIRRFGEVMGESEFNSSPLVAEAYLWAGYANRILSENMCQAVIDGSGAQDRSVYTDRALGHFNSAISIGNAAGADDVVTAATAGRASIHAWMNNWTDAVTDANAVPKGFEWEAEFYNTGDIDEANRIHHATKNQPYKTATVWGTVWELHYTTWDDPRSEWIDSGQPGDGGVDCCGPVPFYVQQKYPEWSSNMDLSDGREMLLIRAEALLVQDSDIPGAMALLDELRADVGVDPLPAPADMAEAWASLKRERGAELWLEARRLGDFFRWDRDGRPGALHPREVPGPESHMQTQDLCFPIAQSEIDTNPNIGG